MLIDALLQFDPAGTAITTGGASTNTLDLLNARDLSNLEHPQLYVTVLGNGLFAASGAATLTVAIQGSADNATWTTYAQSAALPIATLNSNGYLFTAGLPAPPAGAPLPRYLRLQYIVATGPFTAGAVQAFMNIGVPHQRAYPNNYPTTNI